MARTVKTYVVLIILILLCSCTDSSTQQKIRIGINTWPGFEFIYLADQKGFYKDEGLNIEILELSSLADVQRVFEQERVDGMSSTIIEAVDVVINSDEQLDIVLVPDYSYGSDSIIANKPIASIPDLKGKTVGVELGLLGSYILSRALDKNNLSLDDVTVINVEQLNAKESLLSNKIDAMVTYSPFSSEILKYETVNQIFTTVEIPEDVIDVITIRRNALGNPQEWQNRFIKAWQKAIDYANTNPDDAYRIMSEREGITPEEFTDALTGIALIEEDKQYDMLNSKTLENNIFEVCKILIKINGYDYECSRIHDHIGPITH